MDHLIPGEDHRPFNGVFQLPDIAGPGIAGEQVYGRGADALDPLAVPVGVFFGKVIRQQDDVAFPFPQGGDVDGEHVEPVVEIVPETARLDRLF